MIVGLQFEVENKRNSYLKKIFESIDLSVYYWEIVSDQIRYEVNGIEDQGLFNSCVVEELKKRDMIKPNTTERLERNDYCSELIIDGKSFVKAIKMDNYYFIFSDLKAYSNNEVWGNIETYEDYIDSCCELIFMCVDSVFIEIYCKDEAILRTIHDNCIKNNFDAIKVISDDDAKGKSVVAF